MKYYSETLKKFFDSVDECEAAEAEHKQKMDERETRLTEIEELNKNIISLKKDLAKLISEYEKDFGTSFFTKKELKDFNSLLDWMFN